LIGFRQIEADRKALDGLAINPSLLADDGKRYTGLDVVKPWGKERELWLTREVSVWRLYLDPGQETSMHCHTNKTTLMIVESGEARLETLGGESPITGSVLIERGVFHRLKSPSGAVVIEVEWPPNRCDLVRLEDKYERKATGYEGC
jgi:mannose-6-phosphate isomerase-like protein (cupin superfamily)